MVVMYEGAFVCFISGYHPSAFFVPHPFNLLQLVCIYPWVYHCIVLLIYWIHRFHFFLRYDLLQWGSSSCSDGSNEDMVW